MNKNILKNKKKVVIIGFVVFVLLSAMYFIYSQENKVRVPDENNNTNSKNITNDIDNAETKENDNVENEENIGDTDNETDENNPVEPKIDKAEQEVKYFEYINEGLKYKSEGDAGNKDSYYKSIEAYQKASDVAEGKVWIPYLNLGNVYRLVSDYENAEKSYDKALEITLEGTVYKAKIDMYRYELKKPEDEMIFIYEEAIEKVVDNINIVKNYAAYLRDIEKYSESLEYWKIISEKYPDEQMYKDEISGIETKLK